MSLLRSLASSVLLAAAASSAFAGDSVVVINEIHYNPAGGNQALEFVELHNQLSVNVDMSGWRFDGGITYGFPEGTVIPARGYLVVAKDPSALQTATGYAGALGPFTGQLSNDGESLKLYNNNSALRTRPNAPNPPNAGELWSLDIQGDGANGAFGQVVPTLMTGPEPISGLGNIWNSMLVPGHSGTAVNPSVTGLKDSSGVTTGVGFSITGVISAFSYAPNATAGSALYNDYLFIGAGNSPAALLPWQITGLDPAKLYSIWFYGGNLRAMPLNADRNGNGTLADDSAFTAPVGGGVLVSGIKPDATGKIIGTADGRSSETNWSGFQIFIPGSGAAPFQPGTYNANLDHRRLMEEVNYKDSGAWPVGPDGSGFTLAKIDPQGGSDPKNWTTSGQLNGTPGALNFAVPGGLPTAALDTSGNNRHATSLVGVTQTTGGQGYEGEAFAFDGAGAVNVPIDLNPAVLPSATIGAFVRVTGLNAVVRHEIISSDNGGYDRTITIDSRLGGGDPTPGVAHYSAFGGTATGVVQGMNATTGDGWAFVCAVFDADANQTRLYVNANAPIVGGKTHDGSQTFLRFGSHPSGSEFFRGLMDNAFAFKRALTTEEVDSIRIGGAATLKSAVLAPDLLGLYEFEPGPGAVPLAGPSVALNEVAGAGDATFRVELYNYGAAAVSLDGWKLVDGDTNSTYTFPAGTLEPGAYLALDQAALGFRPLDNARLFLFNAGKARLVDAARVANSARARQVAGMGRWLRPNGPTFGSANTFSLTTSIVINEIFYHAFDEGPEQWVELKNRSAAPVSLAGWKFTDGIDFTFPAGTILGPGEYLVVSNNRAALLAKYPGRNIVAGNFEGNLAGGGEHLLLEDAAENPADEVTYEDSGRWPAYADGGGASLELRDANADNTIPESWAPSATAQLGAWETVTYSAVATDDGLGNDSYNATGQRVRDFLLGLLDAGEVLIDDVSVRENPAGANTEFIQNGNFETDVVGAAPQKWRLLGTHGAHGRTMVVSDPDNPANKCLRVVATGQTEDKHNRIETTFLAGRQVTVGNTYQVSFRVRWLAGINKVNTRLFFNYLQKTSTLHVGSQWGTPGLVNSAVLPNTGPTASGLAHSPVVPAALAAVTVSAVLTDPDGITGAQLFYRVAAGGWQSTPMSLGPNGRYAGTIPGQAAAALVQFYVSSTDGAGVTTNFPAAGQKGGAFFRVNDGNADATGLRGTFRILTAPESEALLLLNTNLMSNDDFPATVIEDERTAYYDTGLRLKGSAFGRYNAGERGYNLDFQPDQPFRGVHTSVSIERAGNMKEIVAKHILNRAGGGYWSQYDDVAKIVGPGGVNAPGLIAAARTTSVFLDSLFPGESSGTVFNHELLYQANNTVDGQPESLKLNNPYNHDRGSYDTVDRGADKEVYRWGWQIRNQRKRDDYSSIVRFNRAFALTGTAFTDEMDATIDVDQFMRTWAIMALYGNDDQFGRQFAHNWRLYARPTDGRLIALPWDLDRAFQLGTSDSLTPTNHSIPKLFTPVAYKRAFDSHVLDLVNTTINSTYMTPWITHLTAVTGETAEFAGLAGYIGGRSGFALSTLPASVPFAITTNSGNDFTTAANTTALDGTGWVDVYTITRTGQTAPLSVTWTSANTWRATLALTAGVNAVTLEARDQHGTVTGTDTINITSSTTNVPASAANIVISEIHYHPGAPGVAEVIAGYDDADDFQFVELQNIGAVPVELAGSGFTQGLTYNFTQSTVLPAGGVFVLARHAAAFQMRYGSAPGGVYVGRLQHDDETVTLISASSAVIKSFNYTDNDPWPVSADGDGYSLILRRPAKNPDPTQPINWSSSAAIGGSPGVVENITFAGWLAGFPGLPGAAPLDDPDRDGFTNAIEYAVRKNPGLPDGGSPTAAVEPFTVSGVNANYFVLRFRRHIGVVDVIWKPKFAPTLISSALIDMVHVGSINNGDGTETVTCRSTVPVTSQGFGFLQVTLETP